jgi:hypothetical protein
MSLSFLFLFSFLSGLKKWKLHHLLQHINILIDVVYHLKSVKYSFEISII